MRKIRTIILAAMLLPLAACGYNGAVADEAGIVAQWEDNIQIRDSMVKKIGDAMHIAEAERDSLGDVVEQYMAAQNPEDGRGQLMQWTQNAGVPVSPANFEKAIAIMEDSRNEFKNGQTRLIDRQRSYKTSLNSIPNGPVLKHVFGFPQAMPECDFSKTDPYCPAVDKDKDGIATVLDFPAIVSADSKQVAATGEDNWTLGGE